MSRIKEKSNDTIKILDMKLKVEEYCIVVDFNKKLQFESSELKEEFLELTNEYIEKLNSILF